MILEFEYSDAELAFLMAHDSDPFNRWEAGQRLAMRQLLALIKKAQGGAILDAADAADAAALAAALRLTLKDAALDPAFRELVLALPSETMLAEQVEVIDPQAIHAARQFLRRTLGAALRADLLARVSASTRRRAPTGRTRPRPAAARLKNSALAYLAEADDAESHALAQAQYEQAGNMSDRLAALSALVNSTAPGRAAALAQFYADFESEALVIDKWFTLQAMARTTDVAAVRALMQHPAFTLHNPNRARSLIFSFCNGNPSAFHAADGSGYAFWAEQVIALNAINPQLAARLARSLDRWRKFAPPQQQAMRAALQRVAAAPKLSKDVLEVVTKSLAN